MFERQRDRGRRMKEGDRSRNERGEDGGAGRRRQIGRGADAAGVTGGMGRIGADRRIAAKAEIDAGGEHIVPATGGHDRAMRKAEKDDRQHRKGACDIHSHVPEQ